MSAGLLLLLFLVVGAGNYLMRFLPLLLALERQGEGEREAGLLSLVAPAVVVALLVSSLLPEGSDSGLLRGAAALVPTLLVALRFDSLGLTVLTGVVAYWLVSLVA